MNRKLKPTMNRILVKRQEDAVPLFYEGREVEIKDGQVFSKGSSIAMGVSAEQVRVVNREIQGEVIALGPYATKERFGFDVKVGDIIRYSFYAAGKTRIDGESFDVINDEDVHTVVTEG